MKFNQLERKAALAGSKGLLALAQERYELPTHFETESEYIDYLIQLYSNIYDSSEKAPDCFPMSEEEVDNQVNYYRKMFGITENHGFWVTERRIHSLNEGKSDDKIIAKLPFELRQRKFVQNLDQFPEQFIDFKNLRKNTIDLAYNLKDHPAAKESKVPHIFIDDLFYNYLTKGE